jgi:amidase
LVSLGQDYDTQDALGLAALVAAREVTPLELLEEALRRLDRVNGQINAVIQPMFERARSACGSSFGGPFQGVPFLLKDLNLAYPGVPLRMGSRYFRDHIPMEESELVTRFRKAGLNVFGKTSTPEFGLTPSTEPELHGPCRNPWDLRLSPGGSSGGSAAAVAAGIVPMASASDGGGSIRIPASCCGLFGIKPSRGRTPSGPDSPDLWHGLIAEHAITRTVRDSAALLDVIAGGYAAQLMHAPPAGGAFLDATLQSPGRLRVAVSYDPVLARSLHPDCRTAVEDAATLLASLGHDVEEIHLPVDREQLIVDFTTLVAGELGAILSDGERVRGRRARRAEFELRTWGLMRLASAFTAAEAASARWSLQQFARRWLLALAPFDVLLTSTLGAPPLEVGALRPTAAERLQLRLLDWAPLARVGTRRDFLLENSGRLYDYVSQTIPANVTGQPAMSVPLHWTPAGVPIGVQCVARPGDERTLFRLAAQLEQARPWAGRRPPLWAGTD